MSIERGRTDEQNPNTPLLGLWGCGVLGFWVGLTHILVGMWVCGVLPTSLVRTPEPQNVTTPTAGIWGSGGGGGTHAAAQAWTRLSNQRLDAA